MVSRFALHPDGRRVAGSVRAAFGEGGVSHPELVLVTDFFEELRQRLSRR